MGSAAYAHIAFGVSLDYEARDRFYAEEGGWFGPYYDMGEYLASRAPRAPDEEDNWRQATAKRLGDEAPVEIATGATSEEPDIIVYLKGTLIETSWDSAKSFKPRHMVPAARLSEVARAKRFCQEHDIHDNFEPEWLLFASYG